MAFDKLRAGPVRTRVWSAGRLLILVAALGLTYGAFFLAAMRVANRAREVQVPDIRGQSTTDAAQALAGAGLVLKIDPLRRPDPKIAADHVLAQEPDPGTVLRRQRAVRVRVSDGQRDPVVPSVLGRTERTAELALTQSHVTVTARDEIHVSDYPPDTVVGQDPPAKLRASEITLLINRIEAEATYVMPDLIGTLGAQVENILRTQKFRVTIVAHVPYPGMPPGIVVRQTPQAGFQIGSGEAISLEVSK